MAIAKKKKRFYNIEIPLIKKETQLQAIEEKELIGRFIKYDLTRILKGKGSILTLKIQEDLKTSPTEFRILPFYLKRMVRRGTNYVEDSFPAKSKDSEIKIKPFLVTRRKVSRPIRHALRLAAKEELIKWAEKKDTEELFEEILKNKIQKELSLKLKKIYPLSLCEIRVLKVLKKIKDSGKDKIENEIKAASQTKSEPAKKAKEKAVKEEFENKK
jgi:ribosomal protein S3AE